MNPSVANKALTKIGVTPLRPVLIYGLALVLTTAMFLLRLSLPVSLGERPMLILFMFPILATALLGGFRPGLFTTAIVAACTALLIPPANSFAIGAGHDLLQWVILIINGILVSAMSGLLHHSKQQETEKWQKLVETERQLRESESQYQSTFENAAVGIALVGLDGRWLRVNHKLCSIVGYSPEELNQRTFQDLTHPDDLQADLSQVQRLMAGEIPTYAMDKRYLHKGGNIVWVNLNVSVIRKPDGVPDHFVSMVEDISYRKNAEVALYASEMSYRSLFENMINGYSHCLMLYEAGQPVDFIYLNVNKAFEHMTGLKDVVGRKVCELVPGIRETNPEVFIIYGRVALGGKPERFEIYVALLQRWFAVSVFSPKTEQFVAIVDDITELKTAELTLRQSEEMQRAILDSVDSHIAVLDNQGIILAVNRPWKLFAEENSIDPDTVIKGFHVGENYLTVCQRSTGDYSEGAVAAMNGIKAVLSGGMTNFNMEYPCHSLMHQRWFCMSVTPLEGAQRGVVIAHTNITERKMAERALILLRDDLSATLQAIPDLLFEIDEEGRYIKTTQEDLLFASPSRLLGSTVQQILPAEAAQTVLQAIAAAKLVGSDYGRTILLPLPEGEHCFELSVARKTLNIGRLQHFIVLSRDITKRTAAEAALRQQTQELAQRNTELQRFNRAMVDRELTMIELKKEVNALSEQLSLNPPYPLDFLDTVPQTPPTRPQ